MIDSPFVVIDHNTRKCISLSSISSLLNYWFIGPAKSFHLGGFRYGFLESTNKPFIFQSQITGINNKAIVIDSLEVIIMIDWMTNIWDSNYPHPLGPTRVPPRSWSHASTASTVKACTISALLMDPSMQEAAFKIQIGIWGGHSAIDR